jgi:hypothetical protein
MLVRTFNAHILHLGNKVESNTRGGYERPQGLRYLLASTVGLAHVRSDELAKETRRSGPFAETKESHYE